jgi:hypothetical protein
VITQTKFEEGVEVLRLHGEKRLGGKDMIKTILKALPARPAPSLLPCLLGIAMQPPIDIVQIVGAQLLQHTQLEFMLTRIFEDIATTSLDVAPGDDLPVFVLVLRCIEVATEQSSTTVTVRVKMW